MSVSVPTRECESESVASMWITRVRVRDPLSRRLSSSTRTVARLVCPYPCPLSARAYLWPFPYDALGSELRRTPTCIIYPLRGVVR